MDASWWSLGQDLLLQHVVLAVAIVLFVEELGVPLLVPGDILMMLAGIEVARGNARLWEVLSVEMAVTMVAATILFFLSRGVGRPILLRYGRYLGVDQVRIAQVQGRISRYQFRAVVVGRLTPGLRVLTVMVAGLIDLEARRFLPALAVGAFLYLLAYTLLGYFAGTAAIQLVERLSIPVSSAVALGGLALLFLGFRAARDSRFLRRPLRPAPRLARAGPAIWPRLRPLPNCRWPRQGLSAHRP